MGIPPARGNDVPLFVNSFRILASATTSIEPFLLIGESGVGKTHYGAQLLNVHLHGTLVQDIPSEMRNAMDHDGGALRNESLHPIRIGSGPLAELADLVRRLPARVEQERDRVPGVLLEQRERGDPDLQLCALRGGRRRDLPRCRPPWGVARR